ncbi:hypothetical protein GQR58_024735 [Nymphon striatum]|nr:hypothetical protein GQR58_024735 [Nymphon striatum]
MTFHTCVARFQCQQIELLFISQNAILRARRFRGTIYRSITPELVTYRGDNLYCCSYNPLQILKRDQLGIEITSDVQNTTFSQDRAPFMSASATQNILKANGIDFFGNSEWPGSSLDLNSCEHLGAILKQRDRLSYKMEKKLILRILKKGLKSPGGFGLTIFYLEEIKFICSNQALVLSYCYGKKHGAKIRLSSRPYNFKSLLELEGWPRGNKSKMEVMMKNLIMPNEKLPSQDPSHRSQWNNANISDSKPTPVQGKRLKMEGGKAELGDRFIFMMRHLVF